MTGPCIIVGYGPGIGAAVARAFGRKGVPLALIARNAAKLEAAAAGLTAAGHPTMAFPADAGDEASLNAALEAVRARLGEPEVLVYNAASWRPGPVLATMPADLDADFRTCVTGALTAVRAVAPGMSARGRGSILFTSGGFALSPNAIAPTLSIGKAGLRALVLMLARELAPAGVRVGMVTVMGRVQPGTRFDPDAIADAFIALHRGAVDPTTAEFAFD